jgi:hypothetical protein
MISDDRAPVCAQISDIHHEKDCDSYRYSIDYDSSFCWTTTIPASWASFDASAGAYENRPRPDAHGADSKSLSHPQ